VLEEEKQSMEKLPGFIKKEKTIDSSNYCPKKLLWQHIWQRAWTAKQLRVEITIPNLFRI